MFESLHISDLMLMSRLINEHTLLSPQARSQHPHALTCPEPQHLQKCSQGLDELWFNGTAPACWELSLEPG